MWQCGQETGCNGLTLGDHVWGPGGAGSVYHSGSVQTLSDYTVCDRVSGDVGTLFSVQRA